MPKSGSRVRSAKGKVVDFDLLKIKRQIAGKPVTIDVKARQAFIDQKARRRLRKQVKQVAATAAIDVDNKSLSNVEPTPAQPLVDAQPQPQVVDLNKEDHKHTKQKIRPPRE